MNEEITRLEAKAALALKDLYASLTPWQKTQVARHPQRPHCLDVVAALIADFTPMAGDRKTADTSEPKKKPAAEFRGGIFRQLAYATSCLQEPGVYFGLFCSCCGTGAFTSVP